MAPSYLASAYGDKSRDESSPFVIGIEHNGPQSLQAFSFVSTDDSARARFNQSFRRQHRQQWYSSMYLERFHLES